jgi:hypothetical protein
VLLCLGLGWRATALVLVGLLPLAAVASLLGGRPGWFRGSLVLLSGAAWLAIVGLGTYGTATGDNLLGESIARAQGQVSPAAVVVAEVAATPTACTSLPTSGTSSRPRRTTSPPWTSP